VRRDQIKNEKARDMIKGRECEHITISDSHQPLHSLKGIWLNMKGRYLWDSEDISDGSCEREYNAVMEWCDQDTRIGSVAGQTFKVRHLPKRKNKTTRYCNV